MFRLLSIILLSVSCLSLKAQHVAISPSSMNVLYVGLDNPIDIAAEGILNKDLIVRINEGSSIAPIETWPGHYIVNINKVGTATIRVYQKLKNGNEKLLHQQEFRVRRIPEPVVYIGNNKEGVIAHNTLKAQKGISLSFGNVDFDLDFDIISFTLYTPRDEIPYRVENYGPRFGNDVRMLIDSAKPGDILVFEDIVVVQPHSVKRKLSPVTFIIDGLMNRSYVNGKMQLPIYPVYNNDSSAYIVNRYSRTTRVGQKTFGTYDESYAHGIQRIHGQYILDTTAVDTVDIINPETLRAEKYLEYRPDSMLSGEWLFYNRQGILERKEVYDPKKNSWVVDK